ncbi:hypothetical protein HDC92_000484 [Pedobacter sp. AK017]|nr:hypothetical protein [Pedobacter sp. AK017]
MGTKIYEFIVFLEKTLAGRHVFVNMYTKTDNITTDNITIKVSLNKRSSTRFVII